MNSLAARKAALVAESEVYRHALGMEIQNLRLYTVRLRKRVDLLRVARPLLSLLPLLSAFVGKKTVPEPEPKAGGWSRWWRRAMVGWRVYRTVAPFLSRINSLRGIGIRVRARAAAKGHQSSDSHSYADS